MKLKAASACFFLGLVMLVNIIAEKIDIEGNIDRFENIYKEMIIYSELFTIIFF